ncbi:MAG: universal stress protein [Actinomycetota bacterium]|nr:universal stress protein [Actinomycetota bacterium]
MKRILVATDGSSSAEVAVLWAGELAAATGAQVVAATVVEPHGHDPQPTRDEVALQLTDQWTLPLTKLGVDHEPVVLVGDPRVELADLASSGDFDVVVTGARGAGGFHGLVLGGVAHYLAHHTPCPLIAAPADGGALRGGTIVVGADGSEANEAAMQWAAGLAAELGATVVALFVHSPLADVMTHTASNWQYPGEADVRAAAKRARSKGARIEVVLAAGNPAQELARAGVARNACLLVAGRRGRGGLHGMVLGRVPTQLLHHADRAVAIVPH